VCSACLCVDAGEDADADGWLSEEDCDDEDPQRHPEVEEVCEDAFAEAWRKLDELRAAEAFGAWVRKIARRLALRRIRARARTRSLGGGLAGMAVDPLSGDEARVLRDRPAGSRDVYELAAGPGSDPSERLVIRDLYERIALEARGEPRTREGEAAKGRARWEQRAARMKTDGQT
jgi:DNA-directed RNA polymerase specialized sigma24 family protein